MKSILLIFVLFFASCASHVIVKKSTCELILGDIYKCEEVK